MTNTTDVGEIIAVLGLGALEPKLAEDITNLAKQVDQTGKKGSITIKIDFNAHKKENYFVAKTKVEVDIPKSNGNHKDNSNYSDVLRIDPETDELMVLSKSEIED